MRWKDTPHAVPIALLAAPAARILELATRGPRLHAAPEGRLPAH